MAAAFGAVCDHEIEPVAGVGGMVRCKPATIRRRGGGGSGTQKFVYQKWSDQIFPICKFHFFPVTLIWGGGGVLLWLSAVLMVACKCRRGAETKKKKQTQTRGNALHSTA